MKPVDEYIMRLQGVELREYTLADCRAAVGVWCQSLPLKDKDRLACFLFPRANRGTMGISEALLRAGGGLK